MCVLMHCNAVQLRTLFLNLSLTSLRSAWGRPPPQCTPLSSMVGEEPDCMTADASDRRALSQGRGDDGSLLLHTRQRASGGARSLDPMESENVGKNRPPSQLAVVKGHVAHYLRRPRQCCKSLDIVAKTR